MEIGDQVCSDEEITSDKLTIDWKYKLKSYWVSRQFLFV